MTDFEASFQPNWGKALKHTEELWGNWKALHQHHLHKG